MQKTLSSIFICFLEGYKFHVKESPIGSYLSHTFIEGKENTSSIEPKIPTTKISSCKYQFTINYVWQIMVVIFLLNQQFVSNNRKSIITEDDVPLAEKILVVSISDFLELVSAIPFINTVTKILSQNTTHISECGSSVFLVPLQEGKRTC